MSEQGTSTTLPATEGLGHVLSSSVQVKDSMLAEMAHLLPSQAVDGLYALAVLPPPEQLALGAATALLGVLYGLKVGKCSKLIACLMHSPGELTPKLPGYLKASPCSTTRHADTRGGEHDITAVVGPCGAR